MTDRSQVDNSRAQKWWALGLTGCGLLLFYPAETHANAGTPQERDGVKSLVDWMHEGRRGAGWEVREFERGVNQPKT